MDSHQYANIVDQLRRYDEKIFGNGEPGLLSDVRELKGAVDRNEITSASNSERLEKIERMLYMGVGALAALQLLLKFIK